MRLKTLNITHRYAHDGSVYFRGELEIYPPGGSVPCSDEVVGVYTPNRKACNVSISVGDYRRAEMRLDGQTTPQGYIDGNYGEGGESRDSITESQMACLVRDCWIKLAPNLMA